jgi:hypothetical protein
MKSKLVVQSSTEYSEEMFVLQETRVNLSSWGEKEGLVPATPVVLVLLLASQLF